MMGIAIRYEGETSDINKIKEIIQYAVFTAKSLGWEAVPIEEEGYVVEEKLTIPEENKVIKFKLFYSKELYKKLMLKNGKESYRFGVIINPREPFKTESLEITFFRDGDKWVIKGFTKTQVFDESFMPNLVAHQIIITMLLTIKYTWLKDMEIVDEGEYYVPLKEEEKEKIAKEHIAEEYRERFMKLEPFDFKRLVENQLMLGKIINMFASAIADLGFNVETPSFKIFKENMGGDIR